MKINKKIALIFLSILLLILLLITQFRGEAGTIVSLVASISFLLIIKLSLDIIAAKRVSELMNSISLKMQKLGFSKEEIEVKLEELEQMPITKIEKIDRVISKKIDKIEIESFINTDDRRSYK